MPKIANGADLMLPGMVVDYDKGVKAYHDGKINKVKQNDEFLVYCE